MPGAKQGGLKAAATNKARHGDDFYGRIGARGGSKCVPKGFAIDRELAKLAGAKGGKALRRTNSETRVMGPVQPRKFKRIEVDHQEGDWLPDLVLDPVSMDNKRHMKVMPF